MPDPVFAAIWRARNPADWRRASLQTWSGVSREGDVAALNRVVAEATGGGSLAAPVFARRVAAWLKQNHEYSLAPAIPPGTGDSAGALAGLARRGALRAVCGIVCAAGADGGISGARDHGFSRWFVERILRQFSIRNADAHAWAEIFDDAAGAWLRVDPLAPVASAQTEARGEAALALRLDRSGRRVSIACAYSGIGGS